MGRLPQEMAEYRVHPGGVWTGASATKKEKVFLQVYGELDRHFGGKHHAAFSALAFMRLLNIACVTDDEAERSWALREAKRHATDSDRTRWPVRARVKRLVGYRLLRLWRVVAYGSARGRTQ